MFARLSKLVLSLPFLIAAGLFVFYVIFGFFLVNPVAKKLLPWIGESKLASQLSVQRIDFNPLTLEATVQGLKLAEQSGQPLASFDRLYVNLETTGLFRFAWRIKDIQLSGPRAEFLVRPGGTLNWAALIAKLNEDKTPPSKTMPRVLIDHIKIEGGDVEYTDANRSSAAFKASLQPLGVELDGLSTLPEDRGDYVLAAKLPEQGGTLKWDGDVSLNPVKSDGKVALEGVSLPSLLKVIKTPRNFELPSATLAAGMRYRFVLVKDKPWLQVNGANLIVQNVSLVPRGGSMPVFELKEARVDNASLDLAAQKVEVAGVSVSGAKLAATRGVDGKLDWESLFSVSSGATPPPAAPAAQVSAQKSAPWKLAVKQIRLDDWSARYTDQGFAHPLSVEVAGFGLNAALVGEIGATSAIQVEPVNLGLGPVQVFSGEDKTPVARFDKASLSNAAFDMAANKLTIAAIELAGARTSVVLGKDKLINWNRILARAPGARAASQEPSPGKSKPALDLQLGRLAINGVQVAVSDQSTATPVNLDIVNAHASATNLSLDLDKPIQVEAGLSVKQGGTFSASGKVVPGRSSGALRLKLAGFALQPFAPYVNQFAKLRLRSGAASTAGSMKFAQGRKGLALDYTGGFVVNDLAITEEETDEAFLGWQKLASDSLQFKLGPNSLHMTELTAIKPFAKIIIYQDKTLNLKRILRSSDNAATAPASPATDTAANQEEAAAPAPAKSKASVASPKAEEAAKPAEFPLAIERVRIEDANAEFADLSLPTPFGTRMHSLGGVITGLSTDPATTAQVELDGQVDEFGSARVRGSIQPFRATDFTDLLVSFHNLEMANLTPYSGKFAGRKIDSGRLSVDLEYKIKNRQLSGENKFVINTLKLGERVDSKDAMHLPLDLAIALLEDSNGIIDLDLPVSGSLDDPKFSYGKIIWKAIVNVLTKLVTAPFRALGHLLGISSEKLEAIDFDFGSANLLPPEKEKLKNLGQAMAKRPALALTVAPAYEIKGDTRAIQELWIRRDVASEMRLKIEPDKEPGPVDTTNPSTQKALESLYDKRFDKQGGLKALKAEYEKPKPGARPIHAEMLERLTLQIPVTEGELQRLAQQRGAAVKRELVEVGKLDPAKVSVGAAVKQADGGKLVVSKMSLGVSKAVAAPSATATPTPTPAASAPAGAAP